MITIPPDLQLVSLDVAKAHVNVTDPALDAEITLKIVHASGAIYRYCDVNADPTWTATTAPDVVQAATLKLLTSLYENKGDDDGDRATRTWADIDMLLKQIRDPALA